MKNLDKHLEKIKDKINSSKKVFVAFDQDLDGTSSYIQLKLGYSNISGAFAVGKSEKSQEKLLEKIDEDFDCVIFLDTAVIHKFVFESLKDRTLIWIDHHVQNSKELIEEFKVFHFNPLFLDKDNGAATSFWIYKIMESSNKENLFWATLGSLGDFSLTYCVKRLFDKTQEEFNLLFEKINLELQDEAFNFLENPTSPQKGAELIRKLWFETSFINYKMFFDLLYKFEKTQKSLSIIHEILNYTPQKLHQELFFGKEEHFVEFRNILKTINSHILKSQKLKFDKILWYEYSDTSFSLNRQLSEELQYKVPLCDVIICAFWNEEKNVWTCSFRSQNKWDSNKIITQCLKGLKGNGGGHKYASGASICKKDFEEFKKRVFKMVEE